MLRWRIELLGGVRVVNCAREITRFRTQKSAALLAYLAYYWDRAHPRECLIEMFWPDSPPAAARQSLSQALSHLRHPLEPPGVPPGAVLIADRASVCLNAHAITTDVAEFNAAMRSAEVTSATEHQEHLTRAVTLFRGELLPHSCEDWVLHERPWLTERYFGAQTELVSLLGRVGERQEALELARRGLAIDPLREDTHRELIRLLLAQEEPTAALRQYRELQRLLREHLDADPEPATQALIAALNGTTRTGKLVAVAPPILSAIVSPTLPDSPASSASPPPPPMLLSTAVPPPREDHLPLTLTRFFGREEEIAALCELLGERAVNPLPFSSRPRTRLVTLTGPGGSGKTRLALEVARRTAPTRDGSVWFVPLADLTEGRRLPEAIRDALALPRRSDQDPLEQAIAELSRRPSLLLLDNLEHLVDEAAPTVMRLLERVPGLTCLVTSRRRLDLEGEREFPVAPLPTPANEEVRRCRGEEVKPSASDSHLLTSSPPHLLIRFPSVQLFVDRAQSVRPDFQLTPGNTAAVAALCRQLEGIPLALELAAARIWVLSPSQMVARIGERFEWLATRKRGVSERHRTMRAAVEWSYQLLALELQRFFAQLSVFQGDWTAGAAEAVCEEPLALDYLEQLRECSLVLAEEDAGEVRFRMLETLREYAADQLTPQEQEALGDRHCRYCQVLAKELESRQATEPTTQARLQQEREHPSFRAAMEWAVSHGDVESALTLFQWHWWWWDVMEHPSQQEEWCRRLLAAPGAGSPAVRGDLYGRIGAAAQRRFDYDTARRCFEQCLGIAREQADPVRLANAAEALGSLALQQCDYEEAHRFLEQGLATHREHGHQEGVTVALGQLWRVACGRGEEERAGRLADEWLAHSRRCRRQQDLGWTLYLLGEAAWKAGAFEEAWPVLEECLTFCRKWENAPGESGALKIMGRVAREQGDHAKARMLLEECLAAACACGGDGNLAPAHKALGELALEEGDAATARSHLERCLAMWRAIPDLRGVAESLALLAQVACIDGDGAAARAAMGECLALYARMSNRLAVAESLEALAAATAWFGSPATGERTPRRTAEHAVLLFAAAQGMRDALGARLPRRRAARREERLAAARESLGDTAFAAAWDGGRAMTAQQVIAHMLG